MIENEECSIYQIKLSINTCPLTIKWQIIHQFYIENLFTQKITHKISFPTVECESIELKVPWRIAHLWEKCVGNFRRSFFEWKPKGIVRLLIYYLLVKITNCPWTFFLCFQTFSAKKTSLLKFLNGKNILAKCKFSTVDTHDNNWFSST